MDYYRPNIGGGIIPSNPADVSNHLLNSASDSYASNYWNVPYSDGLSPMKQIEGKVIDNWELFFEKVRQISREN